MNISLDSALGRQRRLNQIGETINSIAVPSAGYSLRSLSGGDPLAVRVRREVTAASPFESEKDFTVSEVASGALVNFINSTVFTRTDELALDAGAGFVGLGENINCIIGTRYKVTFELKQNSGGSGTVSGNPRFRTSSTFAYSNVVKSSNITESTNRFEVNAATTDYQSYSIEFTVDSGTSAGKNFTFQNLDSDDGYTARNINIEVVAGNGLVATWYDQSGNGNHATQTDTAKQPQIVSSGSLITSNSLPAIDFTTSYTILTRQEFLTGQLNSYFTITETDVGSDSEVVFRQGNNYRLSNEYSGTSGSISSQLRDGAGDNANVSISSDFGNGNIRLTTTLITARGANGHTVFVDGGNETSNNSTNIEDTNFASADSGDFGIGGIPSNSSFDFHGKAFEFIFYNSDQTNNRGALEGNMADHYSITGVPTGANTVDGFVETWYDQSGNSNDITQTDTAKQPKIVDSGSLVTISSKPAFKFDGTNDFLEKETFTQGTLSQPNTFFAVAKLDSNDDTNRKIFDSHNSTGRNMLFLSPTNAGEIGFFATAVITTGETADANNNLFTALYNGTSSVLRVNAVQKAAGNVGTMSMIGLIIGESHNQNSNVWKGNIQEIIIYNSDQTSKFTALETNIKNNYSIS